MNRIFKKLGLDYVYVPFRVKREELGKAIEGMRALNIRGLNVTIPHKVAVIQSLDELDGLALIFGHTGITFGAVVLLKSTLTRSYFLQPRVNKVVECLEFTSVLSFGTFMHLIQDQMWLEPRTLLWPLYGFAFEKKDLTYWVQNILYALRTKPDVYLPELLVGTAMLIWFVLVLVRRRKVYAFIRNGQVL